MRVAILGAGGTIAPAIVRDLAESEEVTAMRLLDLDLRRAEGVAIEHGGGKAQARRADATADLAEQLSGMDVLVNSAAYRINLAAMGACLDAGCHYMDLGGLYHVTAEQLELSGKFEQRGLLALLGIGSAPGKTNLLAARAVRELPGRPDVDLGPRRRAGPRSTRRPQLPLRGQDAARRDHDAPDGADRRQGSRAGATAGRPDEPTSVSRSARARRSSPSIRRSSRSATASARRT